MKSAKNLHRRLTGITAQISANQILSNPRCSILFNNLTTLDDIINFTNDLHVLKFKEINTQDTYCITFV